MRLRFRDLRLAFGFDPLVSAGSLSGTWDETGEDGWDEPSAEDLDDVGFAVVMAAAPTYLPQPRIQVGADETIT